MAKLTERQKMGLVEMLARFDPIPECIQQMQDEYGVTLTTQQVVNYDGGRDWARKRMAAKLKTRFDSVRARFVKEADGIAIAHKSWRLTRLQKLALLAEKQGAIRLAAALYEQAAKEQGGSYTNARVVDMTSAGAPLHIATAEMLDAMTAADLSSTYAEIIRAGGTPGAVA